MTAYAIVNVPSKGRLFVKTNFVERGRRQLEFHRRELEALRALRDLAVPELAQLSTAQRRSIFGRTLLPLIATRYIPDADVSRERRFSQAHALGLSLFVVEQLTAFRRRGLLYCDMKPKNILVDRGFSKALIIDLEGCLPLAPSYPANDVRTTSYYIPPEYDADTRPQTVTEASVVYQVCATITVFLSLQHEEPLRPRAMRVAARIKDHYPELARLLASGTHPRPSRRPASFEEVFDRLWAGLSVPRGARALATWRGLRQPYEAALADAGLPGRGTGSAARCRT